MRNVVVLCFLLFISIEMQAQSCDCPATATCSSCAGGISSFTLRYNGTSAQLINAADQGGIVFSQTVNPNSTFTFSGTIPNDKFQGTQVDMTVNGAADTSIPVDCGTVAVGDTFGSFTIVAAQSKTGGPLCCSVANTDNTPPVISNCPVNILVQAVTACDVRASWTAPTATDNCSVTLTSNYNSNDTFSMGTTTVIYTAKDPAGNISTCSFDVTVTDISAPTISNCPTNITIDAGNSCQAVASWTAPTASDNCSASLTSSHTPGSTFPVGTTVVTYTASDPFGNRTTCTFNVVIKDSQAPVINNCPANINMTGCASLVSWTPPTVTDNCPITLIASQEPGIVFPVGTTTVTYTATDASANTTTCNFNVVIKTDGAPTLKGCPRDTILHTFDDSIELIWKAPQATPYCGTLVTAASHQPGDSFTPGTTEVVYEFTDDTQNKRVCSFNVTVIKEELRFEISKAVTPNGDGINDIWQLTNIEKFNDNSVLVVDRWGNKVFHASGYDNNNIRWDGVGMNGSKVPVGTYFYTVEVRVNGSLIRDTGFVEVIY